MKILIVCDVLGEENNGTTIAAMNLIRYLKKQGEEVRILCADQDKINDKDTFVVPNIYLGALINNILKKNNVNLAKPVKSIIEKALDGVDIVHVMIPFALGVAAAKIAKNKGIPVTAGFHCQAENFTAHILHTMNIKIVNDLVYKVFYKKLYSMVNAIHYPTKFIQDTFESVIKQKTNGYVISNGVNDNYIKKDIERDSHLNEHFNILFIGRFSKEKSHSLLIKAVSYSKYKDNIQLIFAGQGPKKKQILKLSKKVGIIEPICNFYSREELVKVINSSDLYVHPAQIEIEAIACLEAISCGLVPVISDSKRSATNAFAIGENNLFKANNPFDLANKIDYWIEHKEEKEECSKKYLGYTEQFNQETCMEKMHNMLKTYSKKENHTTKKIIYYRDGINDDFANNNIKTRKIDENFKYEHKNPFYKFFEFISYFIIAKPVIFLLNKIAYKQKFVDHLIDRKKDVKGCFIYSNHTLAMGDAFTPNLIFNQRNNIVVNPDAVSIKGIKTLVSMLGGIPVPSTINSTRKFLDCIEQKVNKGECITIYPEAHIWPYYTGIRNYIDSSFRYPVIFNKPVVVLTNTYVPYKKKWRLITHIDGPFYPDVNIDKKESQKKLRDLSYSVMKMRSKSVQQYEKIKYINLKKIENSKEN